MPLPNNGAAYKMSSWGGGQATKEAGEEEGCNNSSSLSSSTATANTSSRTSVRDDVETAYSNSNNNSIRHLQREQPSMIPNTHHRTLNNSSKQRVSSTNSSHRKSGIAASLQPLILLFSIAIGYEI